MEKIQVNIKKNFDSVEILIDNKSSYFDLENKEKTVS